MEGRPCYHLLLLKGHSFQKHGINYIMKKIVKAKINADKIFANNAKKTTENTIKYTKSQCLTRNDFSCWNWSCCSSFH